MFPYRVPFSTLYKLTKKLNGACQGGYNQYQDDQAFLHLSIQPCGVVQRNGYELEILCCMLLFFDIFYHIIIEISVRTKEDVKVILKWKFQSVKIKVSINVR